MFSKAFDGNAQRIVTGHLARRKLSSVSAFCVDSRNTPRHECFCAEVVAIVLSGNNQLRNALIEPESAQVRALANCSSRVDALSGTLILPLRVCCAGGDVSAAV